MNPPLQMDAGGENEGASASGHDARAGRVAEAPAASDGIYARAGGTHASEQDIAGVVRVGRTQMDPGVLQISAAATCDENGVVRDGMVQPLGYVGAEQEGA